jgi:uncharacterized protein (DUF2336 family)
MPPRAVSSAFNDMNMQLETIDEFVDLIESKEIGQRADALRRVTDLFASGAARFSDEQIGLFDDVMNRLAREIGSSARAAFARRLASIPGAPPHISRALALDDEIAVAEPILAGSRELDDDTLVACARTKSQEHMLAISRRASLSETVTDVLVERGNQEVARATVENTGARFSEFGYSTLLERSETDSDLAVCLWLCATVPRQYLLKLFAQASEAVRAMLATADRAKANLIRDMVANASEQLQANARRSSGDYATAEEAIRAINRSGQLSGTNLITFANAGKFDEATIALSIMCDMPIGLIERAFAQESSEQILILAKSVGLTWEATKAILGLKAATTGACGDEFEPERVRFASLSEATVAKAVRFYRLRERAAGAASST